MWPQYQVEIYIYTDIPERSSQPGTMAHIAKQDISGTPGRREKVKGAKCGQCEEKKAAVVSYTIPS